ncbi:hypothetical protein [Rhizobium sp. HT1-10]|uniref:hypothetical protein n=1 Tax=Rhizobium sp. HT1-10 TaxID=3111638 RepID=UPI003C244327
MRIAFRFVLVLCIVGLSWFQFGQHRSFGELQQRVTDNFDARPAREILMLGNSRTYYNHMPQMLREIADSAGSPEKYQITQQTPAGSSLELLWDSSYTQQLLQQTWDDAIVQAESRAFSDPGLTESFETYGPKLLSAIKLRRAKPDLVVNWSYEPTAANPFSETQRSSYQNEIDRGHELIAQKSNAHEIKLGTVWNDLRSNHPEIAMTVDGNHPTLAGSYLYALLLYRDLSKGSDIENVKFVPNGLSVQTALIIKNVVARYSPEVWGYRGSLALRDAQRSAVATR